MTASCMLLSRVSSWRWLERTAAKLRSTCPAVLSMAAATRPISSRGRSSTRARRSPVAEASFTVTYKGHSAGEYFADLLVEDVLVVELKCVDQIGRASCRERV